MAKTVTIRLNDEEREVLNNTAKLYDCSISAAIKRLAFEKIEDEIDLQAIKEYEKAKKEGTLKTRPIDELWKELDLK